MPYKDPEIRRQKGREYAQKWREAHVERAREVSRENFYNNRDNWTIRSQAQALYMREYRKRTRERHAAYEAVKNALQTGKLIKPITCEGCGIHGCRLEAHHPKGYAKPSQLIVEWLCKSCHRVRHPVNSKPFRPRRKAA